MIARLIRHQQGTSSVEMALVLPTLFLMIFGMFQLGVLFEANAGMQHALGEGARLATIYPIPTDATIKAKMQAKFVGTKIGNFTANDVVDGTNTKTLTVSFTMTPNYVFFRGSPVTLTRTKLVYTTT